MKPIPKKLKSEILLDPFYDKCARKGLQGHKCSGRITWEHAVRYAHNQVNQKWAIIPLCAKAHSVDNWQDVGDLDKQVNLWIALNRASDDELRAISKAMDYVRERVRLNALYGVWGPPQVGDISAQSAINY